MIYNLKPLRDYYNSLEKNKKNETMLYSIEEFLECCIETADNKPYQQIIDLALKYGINKVVDIGCSTGCQSVFFAQNNIDYLGIEPYPDTLFPNTKIINKKYPCKISENISAAVSNLCIGYFIDTEEEYKKLAEEFKYLIINNIPDGISAFFDVVEKRYNCPYTDAYLKKYPEKIEEKVLSSAFLVSKYYKGD